MREYLSKFLNVVFIQSKKEGKDQESLQSSTKLDPGYQWESAWLFICALWSPGGKGLTTWLSFVVFAIKEESNSDRVDNQACSLLQYIIVITNIFIMRNYLNKLH